MSIDVLDLVINCHEVATLKFAISEQMYCVAYMQNVIHTYEKILTLIVKYPILSFNPNLSSMLILLRSSSNISASKENHLKIENILLYI